MTHTLISLPPAHRDARESPRNHSAGKQNKFEAARNRYSAQAFSSAMAPTIPTKLPPPTILVVADDVLARMAVSGYLRECGYTVVEVGDTAQAKEVLAADVTIDIAFADLASPNSPEGFALAQWIRREHPAIKVILTSGLAPTAKAAGELCEHGPMLAKPYHPADLERRIRELRGRA
jgi:CheY-like chemotaxis protein